MNLEQIKETIESITLTEDEIAEGCFKAAWQKHFNSEEEWLQFEQNNHARNKIVVKVRDGVYKYQSESNLLETIELLKARLDELDGGTT